MANDQGNRTTKPPSKFEVGGTLALFLLMLAGMVWGVSRPIFNGLVFATFLINLLAAMILGSRLVTWLADAVIIRTTSDFQNTGAWYDPDTGREVLSVYFDPETHLYHASGEPFPGFVIDEGRTVTATYMHDIIRNVERDGLLPGDDAHTGAIRKRLGLTK